MGARGHINSLRRNAGSLIGAAGAALSLSACALAYVDSRGDTHYQGLLLHVVIPKSADRREVRAESVRVQSIGLSLLSGAQRTNLTLGYNDETLTLVRADSCAPAGAGPLSFGTRQGKEPDER